MNPNELVGEMRMKIIELSAVNEQYADRIANLQCRLYLTELAATAMIAQMQATICTLELDLAETRAEQESESERWPGDDSGSFR